MLARFTALLVAAMLFAQGLLPARDGFKCVYSGMQRMAECCPKAPPPAPEAPPVMARLCCVHVDAPVLEPRSETQQPSSAPAPTWTALLP